MYSDLRLHVREVRNSLLSSHNVDCKKIVNKEKIIMFIHKNNCKIKKYFDDKAFCFGKNKVDGVISKSGAVR